jgi:hypothetical protein
MPRIVKMPTCGRQPVLSGGTHRAGLIKRICHRHGRSSHVEEIAPAWAQTRTTQQGAASIALAQLGGLK